MEKDYRYTKFKCTHCGLIEKDIIIDVNAPPTLKCRRCNLPMIRIETNKERKFKFEN